MEIDDIGFIIYCMFAVVIVVALALVNASKGGGDVRN
jgi:hypothetical protein